MMAANIPLAYLRVRRFDTREIVHSVALHNSVSPRYVERIMMGMLINMNTDEYFIDDSEVDAARQQQDEGG